MHDAVQQPRLYDEEYGARLAEESYEADVVSGPQKKEQ